VVFKGAMGAIVRQAIDPIKVTMSIQFSRAESFHPEEG